MAFLFKLPELGEGVMEGELVKWHVREGEALRRDQIVAEVMTDKAAIEVPFPQTEGRVVKLLAREGDLIKIGADVMEYEGEGPDARASSSAAYPSSGNAATRGERSERPAVTPAANENGAAPSATSSAKTDSQKKEAAVPVKQKSHSPSAPLQRATGEHVKASPAVRHRAHELGLSLEEISPSREDGRIVLSDLEKSLRRRLSHSAPGLPERVHVYDLEGDERKPLVGLRKAVLKQMVQSKRTIPHFSYMEEMDASVLVKRRSDDNAKGVKRTFLPYFVKAVVNALKKFPLVHTAVEVDDSYAGEIVFRNVFNIGIAMASQEGLLVPVIRNADKKSIEEIAQEIRDTKDKADQKKLRPEDMGGGTFTITSLGPLGGIMATPIIRSPEVGILSIHAIKDRVVPVAGKIEIRPILNLVGAFDHRVVDGVVAAEFIQHIIKLMTDPKEIGFQ